MQPDSFLRQWLGLASRREREAAARGLRECEERFRTLSELASGWLWQTDTEHRFVEMSVRVGDATGYPSDYYPGRRRWEVEGLSPLAGDWSAHRAMLERHESFRDLELVQVRADGRRCFLRISGAPVFGDDGAFRGYRGTAQDVSAQKLAEEAIGRRDAFYRALVENVTDAIGACDSDWRYIYVSPSSAAMYGYPPDEMIGRRFGDTTLPGEAAALRERLARVLQGGGPPQLVRFELRRRDGALRSNEVLVSRGTGPGGEPIYVLAGRDITERTKGEQALAASERRFRALLENGADAIVVYDRERRTVYRSSSTARVTGYSEADRAGQTFVDVVLPEDLPHVQAAFAAAIQAPGQPQAVRCRGYHKDGRLLWLEGTFTSMLDDPAVDGVVANFRDVTARVQADEALRRREEEYRTVVSNSPAVISRWGRDRRCVFINRSLDPKSGRTPQWYIGRGMAEMDLAPQLAARGDAALAAALDTGEPQTFDSVYPLHDAERYIDNAFIPEKGADGAVRSVLVVSTDVTDRVRAQAEARKREETFRVLAECSPDGIARFDRELRCTFVNPAIAQSTGRPAQWFIGRSVHDQYSAEFAHLFDRALRGVLENGETETVEYRYDTPRGVRHYQARLAPERDGATVTSVVVMSRDVTLQWHAEQRIRESETRLRAIVEATPAPLIVVTREGEIVFANPAAAEILGRTREALAGMPLGLPLAAAGPADVEVVLPAGDTRPVEMRSAAMQIEGRELLVVSLHDLSERRSYERHIEHIANHDALTGLPNRTLLRDRVQQAIVHARRTRGYIALLFVDLDQFKLVNDSSGHLVGDALLMEVGRRLKSTIRDGDTVGRLGGDEFLILLTDLTAPADAALVARKIAATLGEPLFLERHEIHASASIGISLYPADGDDLDSLLQCADAAMYRAKEAGRNGYQFYSAEMGAQARRRVDTEAGLRQALEREELRLHYQPQVSLATGEVLGFEALMRWAHPQRGLVAPAAFIPVAEESGLIVPMGQWALRAACRQAAAWAAAGLGSMKVAVNLSARQFWRGGVTEAVRQALGESGLAAAQLELEITESVVARDLQQVMLTLEQLRRMGVTIAIDDFGTGYSSLAYLRSLPIQKVKIDKSFIQGIPDDREATALVGEIIRLAHVLSLEVVAEGVEAREQASFLQAAGCEGLQGYLVARPMPGEECAPFLRSRRRFSFASE